MAQIRRRPLLVRCQTVSRRVIEELHLSPGVQSNVVFMYMLGRGRRRRRPRHNPLITTGFIIKHVVTHFHCRIAMENEQSDHTFFVHLLDPYFVFKLHVRSWKWSGDRVRFICVLDFQIKEDLLGDEESPELMLMILGDL